MVSLTLYSITHTHFVFNMDSFSCTIIDIIPSSICVPCLCITYVVYIVVYVLGTITVITHDYIYKYCYICI